MLPLLGLGVLMSACGTGLIPPITQGLADITATLPTSTSVPMVVYIDKNQFDSLPALAGIVNSVEIAGSLVYTGLGNLTSVGVYIRPDTVGCTNGGGYYTCTGDESANKLQDLAVQKGVPTDIKLAGAQLNKAVQSKSGYIGFRVNAGSTLNGDKISVTGVKATIRF